MIFIDYLSLLLINMAAGLVILALYLFKGTTETDQRKWSAVFAIPGVIAMLNGLHIIWNWPLPGAYNSAFGEMSIMLGALFLGASLALAKGWDLLPLTIYSFFAGLAAIVLGVRFIDLKLTMTPLLCGTGFILTGLAGVFAGLVLYLRANRSIRIISALILLITAAIWGMIGYGAYWMHMEGFSKWLPTTLKMLK